MGSEAGNPEKKVSHDMSKEAQPAGQSSPWGAAFNLMNTIVGTGIVSVPQALYKSGFGLGVIALLLVAWATEFSMTLIVKTALKNGVRTYEDLCKKAFGNFGFYSINAAIFLNEMITLFCYAMVFGKLILIFPSLCDGEADIGVCEKKYRLIFVASCMTLVVLPICLFRDLSKLEKFSAVSIAFVLFLIGSVVGLLIKNGPVDPPQTRDPADYNDIAIFGKTAFFSSIGTFAFAFTAHCIAFNVFETLEVQTIGNWKKTSYGGVGMAAFLTITMGICGYLTFHECSQDVIFDGYRGSGAFVVAVRCVFFFTIVLTYPLHHSVTRYIAFATFFRKTDNERMSTAVHYGLTFGIWLFSVVVALLTDDLGAYISATGSLFVCFLGFVMPPACYLMLDARADLADLRVGQKSQWQKVVTYLYIGGTVLMLIFGVVEMVAGPTTAIVSHLQTAAAKAKAKTDGTAFVDPSAAPAYCSALSS
eukprot:204628_1